MEKGISQRDLAAKVGVKGPYIAQLETGVRKNPSLDVLKRIAKALRVPVTELLQ
jgi:transcriptional regulator with XRE-family HTH domain